MQYGRRRFVWIPVLAGLLACCPWLRRAPQPRSVIRDGWVLSHDD